MPIRLEACRVLRERSGAEGSTVFVPGRVNLIGEHIDYHGLPVLPMAIQRGIAVAFRPREDRTVRAYSEGFGEVSFEWTAGLQPDRAGQWSNYVKAAAEAIAGKWGVLRGIDAAVAANLPPAAGLSSSSALLTAFTLALLRAAGIDAGFDELMEILPEGEHFVGTRGGGMDHAAVLASRAGSALLVRFAPASAEPIAIPEGWAFIVAHSLTTAEKSSRVREEYNFRRSAGTAALRKLGFTSFAEVDWPVGEERARQSLEGQEWGSFSHVAGEADRVLQAVAAMRSGDAARFGELLNASHASMRDQLRISTPALDELVEAARASGATGARLTGAGFGGCAIVFCDEKDRERVRAGLIERYYAGRERFDESVHLLDAAPSEGALFA